MMGPETTPIVQIIKDVTLLKRVHRLNELGLYIIEIIDGMAQGVNSLCLMHVNVPDIPVVAVPVRERENESKEALILRLCEAHDAGQALISMMPPTLARN